MNTNYSNIGVGGFPVSTPLVKWCPLIHESGYYVIGKRQYSHSMDVVRTSALEMIHPEVNNLMMDCYKEWYNLIGLPCAETGMSEMAEELELGFSLPTERFFRICCTNLPNNWVSLLSVKEKNLTPIKPSNSNKNKSVQETSSLNMSACSVKIKKLTVNRDSVGRLKNKSLENGNQKTLDDGHINSLMKDDDNNISEIIDIPGLNMHAKDAPSVSHMKLKSNSLTADNCTCPRVSKTSMKKKLCNFCLNLKINNKKRKSSERKIVSGKLESNKRKSSNKSKKCKFDDGIEKNRTNKVNTVTNKRKKHMLARTKTQSFSDQKSLIESNQKQSKSKSEKRTKRKINTSECKAEKPDLLLFLRTKPMSEQSSTMTTDTKNDSIQNHEQSEVATKESKLNTTFTIENPSILKNESECSVNSDVLKPITTRKRRSVFESDKDSISSATPSEKFSKQGILKTPKTQLVSAIKKKVKMPLDDKSDNLSTSICPDGIVRLRLLGRKLENTEHGGSLPVLKRMCGSDLDLNKLQVTRSGRLSIPQTDRMRGQRIKVSSSGEVTVQVGSWTEDPYVRQIARLQKTKLDNESFYFNN